MVRGTHWRALHLAAALGDGTAAAELIDAGRSDGLSRLFAQAPGLDRIAFSLQGDLLFRAMWRNEAR